MSDSSDIEVRQAVVADIDLLAPLFDDYRRFYGQAGDVALARAFLLQRFRHNQSVIFMATASSGLAAGFTQLYPCFSSVSAARVFILNDLYVVPEARRCGAAVKLLEAAARFGRTVGAVELELSTAIDNESAQALYVSQGWVRDTGFYHYSLSLDN